VSSRPLAALADRQYRCSMSHDTPVTSGNLMPDGSPYPISKPETQWRDELTPLEYHVLREAGTERPFVGEYTDTKTEGIYSCRACGAELFRSETKFDSHCGWPSFYSPLAEDRIVSIEDRSLGSVRTEVRCAACGGHLGHVFSGEGYGTPTDLRYCINSISMRLESGESSAPAG
jgi:peptide-methionine (R)-S-oxide reductase